MPERHADAAPYSVLQPYIDIGTPQEALLEAAAELAVKSFDCAAVVIRLAGRDRIEPPALSGVAGFGGIAGRAGLCAVAVRSDDRGAIDDAGVDPRTIANPTVARALGMRFHVDLPLRSHRDEYLGTLTLFDRSARRVADDRLASMQALAGIVVDVLEARLAQRAAARRVISAG